MVRAGLGEDRLEEIMLQLLPQMCQFILENLEEMQDIDNVFVDGACFVPDELEVAVHGLGGLQLLTFLHALIAVLSRAVTQLDLLNHLKIKFILEQMIFFSKFIL